MNKEKIKIALLDIRTWIVLFFILRLTGITNAPLETGHNWRQTLTNMIARNFLEGNASLFYPKIDMAGNQSGIIASEFPFFNYLIYLVSLAFDFTHWHGRLINLIVSSFGIFYFYKLIVKVCNQRIAFNATVILLSSIWFSFSRKIMPDTFSVSLVLIGLYHCYVFINTGNVFRLFFLFIFVTMGMLCKIPALSLVSVIFILVIVKEVPVKRKALTLIVTVTSIAIVGAWYFYWVPYLLNNYHYQLYFPKGIAEGFTETWPLINGFLKKFYFSSLHSFLGFGAVVLGLLSIQKGFSYLKAGILVIAFTFLIFTLKTGSVFPTHNYYVIPFVPVLALIAGFGLSKLPRNYQFVFLFLISTEAIANQQHDFFIRKSDQYMLSLESTMDDHIDKNKLIVINGGGSSQEIYFANRNGWTIHNQMINKWQLDSLRNLGASYLVINRKSFANDVGDYPKIFSDNYYDIYILKDTLQQLK